MPLKQPSREREYSLDKGNYASITSNDVKDALWFALRNMKEYSYYGPLIERYPVVVDEGVPKMAMRMLKDRNSPACTDSNNVYFCTEIFIEAWDEWGKMEKFENANWSLIDNLSALLAHEYTHILCQHVRIGREYENKSEMEQHCHMIACEIEANRGHLVENPTKDGYRGYARNVIHVAGVTDDDYPETKKDKYYPQIYATLLKNAKKYEEAMKKAMSMIQDLFASADMDGSGKALQKASKNASKGSKGSKTGTSIKISQKGAQNANTNENKDSAQNESQGNKDNSNGMENTATISSVNRQQNDGEKTDKDVESDWELTQEQIEESIKNAMQVQQTIVQEQAPGSESGYGLESPFIEYKPELTQKEMLEQDYERWHKVEIKKQLAKMKGLIRGTISKNRESTYARPTRRPITGAGGLIKKGVRYEKSYSPKVLIAMDSSGSMCSTTMKEVACAIENIFKDLGKPKVGSYICKHESNVSDVKPMAKWKEVVESYYPSGGNCFAHVVEEANKLGVDVVLNIGDGQDTITRYGYSEGAVAKFNSANRKWFDVLVTSKGNNRYYHEEKEYDENNGFHREGIFLGDEITKYLK